MTSRDDPTGAHDEKTRTANVFLFLPNIIGYFRLTMILASWICHAFSGHNWTVALYVVATILDFFDGYAARCLKQSSAFGAWLDVLVDVVARTMMWNMIFAPTVASSSSSSSSWKQFSSIWASFPWGQLISSLEWLTFVCNHSSHGSRWKSRMSDDSAASSSTSVGSVPPAWVTRCFVNGFKSPLGFFVIAGVHGLPPWLYGVRFVAAAEGGRDVAPWPVYVALVKCNPVVLPFLVCGRCYAACVETWIIWEHIRFLSLQKDD